MHFGSVAQAVKDDAGLDGGKLLCHVDAVERVHVAGEVKDDGDVDALAGERSSRAAGKNGCAGGAAGGDGGLNVSDAARIDDADGQLAVVGGISREERTRGEVEENIAADGGLKQSLKFAMGGEALVVERRLIGKNLKSAHEGMVARLAGAGSAQIGPEEPSSQGADKIRLRASGRATLRRRHRGR